MSLIIFPRPTSIVIDTNIFQKQFDDAGEKNSCMRIKILGDCYYCVAGVPDEDEDHAHHTVQMGLDMIELIQV